ncbi:MULTISPECIES: single-stranded DNA-binding protein [Stenotrophomonas]|uniref:single-stranded DNA-binding protein n=1 Tax=Stenotrophomonas TaxID=40323 RepID=UPI000B71CD9C|nr:MULTISPECIES: single-stranded DNA-binding protein [Stenotrophomonas]SMR68854.1 Helix-destabilising protein [Stenotrophomonas sp. yr243]SNT59259.1 Helix-destabilising protein [Stenotrophomonas lactitubi]
MPICRVKSGAVEERHNTKTNAINRSQTVGLDLGNGFELPFRVGLGQRPAYQPGEYDIDPQSFALSEYGDLVLKRYVDLVPLQAKAAAAPAKP